MTNVSFVFCHGFGFDKSFWINLSPYFAKNHCFYMNLGYFGEKTMDFPQNFKKNVIGIGHSFGFSKLIHSGINFDKIIGICPFTNFCGNSLDLRGPRTQELSAIIKSFQKNPKKTLQNFHRRCGVFIENDLEIDESKVIHDLLQMHQNFEPKKLPRSLIIGSLDDIVVPYQILIDNFLKFENATIKTLHSGKHGLGFLNALDVYNMIREFI